MKSYCTQNNGDCSTCSLVNYHGKDCKNNPVSLVKKSMYFDLLDLTESPEVLEKRETESEFIRTAIRNEIERRRREAK